eukprot:m.71570 g.71570  ORF g.71570 m.71570 type:complete len:217 (+) comp35748_c0_seq1:126-776(+)
MTTNPPDLLSSLIGLFSGIFYLSGSVSLFPAFQLGDLAPLQLTTAGSVLTISSLIFLAAESLKACRHRPTKAKDKHEEKAEASHCLQAQRVLLATAATVGSILLTVATTRIFLRYGAKGRAEGPKIYATGCGLFLIAGLVDLYLERKKRGTLKEKLQLAWILSINVTSVLLIFACVFILNERTVIEGVWLFIVGSVAAILARSLQLGHLFVPQDDK